MSAINTTNFWDNDKQFWNILDDQINDYAGQLQWFQKTTEDAINEKEKAAAKVIADKNAKYQWLTDGYKTDVDKAAQSFTDSSAKSRKEAEDLVKSRQAAAKLEANIASAWANQGQKLSFNQLTSISKDIQNQFQDSINNAKADKINFDMALNDKLLSLGFTVTDKKRMLDEFQKALDDEEAQPLLDAIAERSSNKIEFMNSLKETVLAIREKKLEETLNRSLRESRIQDTEAAFNAMNPQQRQSYIMDLFWPTWNILSRWEQNELTQKAANGQISFAEINNLIQNYKDKAEQNKAMQQMAVQNPDFTKQLLDETGWADAPIQTFTQGQAFKAPTQTTNPQQAEQNRVASIVSNSTISATQKQQLLKLVNEGNLTSAQLKQIENSLKQFTPASAPKPTVQQPAQNVSTQQRNTTQWYTVGNDTFKSQASYNEMRNWLEANKTSLINLQKTNPAGYNTMINAVRAKYIL